MLPVNIHPIERIARGVVGLVLISLVFWGPRTLWGLVGFVFLFTALTGWCPPYQLFGINTCRTKKAGG
jgi:hypothetical protein